ncbi:MULTISPECIES: DUF92 domain-containing protein [Neobacillus]|jgi:uncharacterized protein (TIGR00297 family)|uniref:DUF92 domain-containing protein n=1 Tax=Neobacillus sedimentimangrovi TaxID=2699460 RepID=A0ABS8QG91_9BACI|nr:DUF92 domain-containing protein [Neobacillus sedimentimangrovi]MCD4838122.1 DUF92 domain-containing protein [Neobacillus sedimentimangrovi]
MMEPIFIILMIFLTGFVGYLFKLLNSSGSLAAIAVGLAVFIGVGIKGLLLLGIFFITSSFWSAYKRSVKQSVEKKLAKGATRDWRQVLANGGAAGLFSLLFYFYQDNAWLIGFACSLASANSDTWASEIGSLSKKNPVFIRTFKRVEKGTSGAVSLLGNTAALMGSLLMAAMSFWFFRLDIIVGLLIFLFGYVGNLIDTIIGAYFQQVYRCSQCGLETEKTWHCQRPTKRIKGFSLIDNDMVNFLSGLLVSIIAILVIPS